MEDEKIGKKREREKQKIKEMNEQKKGAPEIYEHFYQQNVVLS